MVEWLLTNSFIPYELLSVYTLFQQVVRES